MTRSYAVLGSGAVACQYGGRFAAAGHEVTFLARSDAAVLRERGLHVTSMDGDISLAPGSFGVAERPEDLPAVDVVLVGLKGVGARVGDPNPAAAVLARAPLAAGTIVVNLQNGLDMEDDLAPVTGSRPLLGGLCFVCANRVEAGRVEHLCGGSLALAARHADGGTGVTEAVEAVAADAVAALIPTRIEADLVLARWRKLVWNVPFNPLSALLGCTAPELLHDPGTRALVVQLMHEVRAAAAATGRAIPASFLDEMLAATEAFPSYASSMALDLASGRPLEVEPILGRPVAAARAAGVAVPAMEVLLRQLAFVDPGRRGAA